MKYKSVSDGQIIKNKDYSKKIIFSPRDFKEQTYLLQIVTIPSHTKLRLHLHKIQTEIYLILEGESIVNINEKEYLARVGDAFQVEPDDLHFIRNQTESDFKLAVFKINVPKKSEDIVWLE